MSRRKEAKTIAKTRRIKLGKICATSKRALKTQACLHDLKCKPKRVGRAVVHGRVAGTVWCCKPKRSLRSRIRRRLRRRSHWQRRGGRWSFA